MQEPTPRNSRLAIAGALTVLVAVGAGSFVAGRSSAPQRPMEPQVVTPSQPPAPTPIAKETADAIVLSRADIIGLDHVAADATSSRVALEPELAKAVGRRFDLAIPFGCSGPSAEDDGASLRWRYDEAASALRVYVEPMTLDPDELWPTGAPAGVTSLEGFWIAQPWSSSESCPPRGATTTAPGIQPITLPGQTLALAQVFGAEGARQAQRRGKPFEVAIRAQRSELDMSKGLRLRLRGRVDAFPGGAPARCIQPSGPEQRPVCVLSVRLDEVSVENPINGATIATWSLGQDAHREP